MHTTGGLLRCKITNLTNLMLHHHQYQYQYQKYTITNQGRLHARFSFCDPNYDKARSEVEGKVLELVSVFSNLFIPINHWILIFLSQSINHEILISLSNNQSIIGFTSLYHNQSPDSHLFIPINQSINQ